MDIIDFTSFSFMAILNFGIYHHFYLKFNKNNDEYINRKLQPISKLTKFIKYFQFYYGPIAIIYLFLRCFYFKNIFLSTSTLLLLIGIFISILGLILMCWSLLHLQDNFSPCHGAKLPSKLILTGPYRIKKLFHLVFLIMLVN